MIDPSSIAQGVVSGIISQKALDSTNKAIAHISGNPDEPGTNDYLQAMVYFLKRIDDALNPADSPNLDEPLSLQKYPYEYVTDPFNHGKAHLSIFFVDSCPLRADIPGIGTYFKTVGPGWVQCDVFGGARLSTTDSTNHNVIVSYRADAIGSTL